MNFFQSHFGEIAALTTAFFWTTTALAFESASKKIGSLVVNFLRLFFAFLIFCIYTYFSRGKFFPIDASLHTWFWLGLSAVFGFLFGDLLLFKAFTVIGARISMLIMSLVPPIAAFAGWLILGETMSLQNLFGMTLTLVGIAIVVLTRKTDEETDVKKFTFSYSVKGLLFALCGAFGQAIGMVLSKLGMGHYDAFAASQIRVLVGAVGFGIIFTVLRRWNEVFESFKNAKAMRRLSVGTFFGPFLGVAFSLLAVQNTSAGIASTLMSIVPILIIAPSVVLFKEKVTVKEILGAFISVIGVVLFFI